MSPVFYVYIPNDLRRKKYFDIKNKIISTSSKAKSNPLFFPVNHHIDEVKQK